MAKPADKPAPAKAAAPKSKMNLIVLVVVALGSLAAGFFAPGLLPSSHTEGGGHGSGQGHGKAKGKNKDSTPVMIPFGDVSVNLRTPNQTRYLRVKVVLVVDKSEEKEITDLVTEKKPFLKNSAISYLADRSLEDVKGTAGINRIRRELRDQFNLLLYPDGTERVRDLLFEEFFTQ